MAGVAERLARERAAAAGLGSHERAVQYLGQDFAALRDACLAEGSLFQDPTFPAVPAALGFAELGPRSSKTRGVEWKRPPVGAGGARACWVGRQREHRNRALGRLSGLQS